MNGNGNGNQGTQEKNEERTFQPWRYENANNEKKGGKRNNNELVRK